MKRFPMLMVAMVACLLWALPARALWVTNNWHPCDSLEAAAVGATHYVEFSHTDLDSVTATNTALVFTNRIAAKTWVKTGVMILNEAFAATDNTNYTESVLIKVGDGSDDDLFLTSTELASEGTEVWLKPGPPDSGAVAMTLQRMTLPALTNVAIQTWTLDGTNYVTNVVNNAATFSAVTNATAAYTGTMLGQKLNTTAGSLVFTFTPNAENSLASFTGGLVRVYFRVLDYGRK